MDEIPGDPGASFPANGLAGLFDSVDRLLAQIGHRVGPVASLRAMGLLTARGLTLGFVGLLLLLLIPPLAERGLRRLGRVEPNFRGERIPQSMGVAILLWAGTMLGLTAWLWARQRAECLLWLAGVTGFGLLGLLDDWRGVKTIKGLRGHFRAAFKNRTITTGFVKAVGGACLALLLAWRLEPDSPPLMILDAALIALSANAVNLLDLRPGRAGGVFLACALPLCVGAVLSGVTGVPPLLLVAIPALRVWERDSRALVMMGDAGSNLLGACLGLALCAAWVAWPIRLLALTFLVALHILAERASLTQLIARHRVLRALDRLTGVR